MQCNNSPPNPPNPKILKDKNNIKTHRVCNIVIVCKEQHSFFYQKKIKVNR